MYISELELTEIFSSQSDCEIVSNGHKQQFLSFTKFIDAVNKIGITKVDNRKKLTIEQAIKYTSLFFEIHVSKIISKERYQRYVRPRSMLSKYLRENRYKLIEIGDAFNRDHTTIIHSVAAINLDIEQNLKIKQQYYALCDYLESKKETI